MPPLESADLLIEARWVLPIAPVNTVLTDHAIAITAGRIVGLGPTAEMNARFEPRERVVRNEHALLPGFVNAHTRAATTLLRGLPVYGPRARWLRETVVPVARRCMSADFVRDGTQLAIAEMLRAGITSFADMYLFPEEAARAASAARMRAVIGLPVTDGPTVWADSATEHLAKAEQLWDEYQSDPWVSLYFAPHNAFGEGDKTLARVRRVADELDARVAMYLPAEEAHANHGGGGPLRQLQEIGLLGPGFTAIHLSGLDAEELEIVAETGICVVACPQSHLRLGGAASPVAEFDARKIGVGFGTDSAVSVGALDVLAEARMAALLGRMSGGPRGRASADVSGGLRGGITDARDVGGGLRAGVTNACEGGGVRRGGLGGGASGDVDVGARGGATDAREGGGERRGGLGGGTSHYDVGRNGFGAGGSREETRAMSRAAAEAHADAANYGAGSLGRGGALSAEVVLRMATLGGAAALGLDSLVGSLEVGKAADLVCFDLAALACQPNARPADAILFGATRGQVSDVWTSGRAAVRDGRLMTFDEQELLALARQWAERLRTGVAT